MSFKRNVEVLDGVPIFLPCGKCVGCRLVYAREWAVRCVHESKMHKENCFVTLTYAPEHLPENGSLVVRDLQLFLKRLRKWYFKLTGRRFRFYASGEYGDINGRPHYHALLFGIDFHDKKLYTETARGDKVYTSAALDLVWQKGTCKIGAVNFESASYVARYCLKKVDGAQREAGHYLRVSGDGVVFELMPEFSTQSRAGGIGTSYYEKYGKEIRAHDSIVVNGQEVPSIRFYDNLFAALDPDAFARVKRERAAKLYSPEYWAKRDDVAPYNRYLAKESIARGKLKLKKRSV